MEQIAQTASQMRRQVAMASTTEKNEALSAAALHIDAQRAQILHANSEDMANSRAANLAPELLERLELNEQRVDEMIAGLEKLIQLPDPVGAMGPALLQPSGIRVGKMRVPLGVIGVIYESRPGVTADAGGLCLKAGNAVILRGGSEAIGANRVIAECMRSGLEDAGLAADIIQLLPSTDRELVGHMLTCDEYIDVIIPRGGRSLIERVRDNSTIPVIKHLHGVCQVYVDKAADLTIAQEVAFNSKTQRYGVCNAMETLLLHQDLPQDWVSALLTRFVEHGVELRLNPPLLAVASSAGLSAKAASEEDWRTEYLSAILSIRQVKDLAEAITHIAQYGSGHTDSIVSQDVRAVDQFISAVDSSSVMANTSTRFADGFQYGLGAEIGISTDRLHVRGPVGLEGLTTEKYVVHSDGAIRS